jgi:hypothetical protein
MTPHPITIEDRLRTVLKEICKHLETEMIMMVVYEEAVDRPHVVKIQDALNRAYQVLNLGDKHD